MAAQSDLAWAAAAMVALVGARAAADPAVCVQAAEQAQSARREAHWVEAQRALVTCNASDCPSVVRGDCERWLRELTALLPSLSICVTTVDGEALPDAQLTLDGTPFPHCASTPVDPGPHTVEAKLAGHLPARAVVDSVPATRITQSILLVKEGVAAPTPSLSDRKRVAIGLIAGSGLLAVIGGGLGISARSKVESLAVACAPRCTPAQIAPARDQAAGADVAFGLALAAGATSAALWFLLPPETPP